MDYKAALAEFNRELGDNPITKDIAEHHGRSVQDVMKALQCRLKVLRYSNKKIKSVSLNFNDSSSGFILKLSKKWQNR